MTKNTRLKIILLALVCVPVVLITSSSKDAMNSFVPESFPFPSTYNKKASGYSALFELCQKVGFDCRRWQLPYRDLDAHHKGTLVIISPFQLLSKNELEHLQKWVRAGNDLVYLDDFSYQSGSDALDAFGLHARYKSEIKNSVVNVQQGAQPSNTPSLKLTAEAVLSGGEPIVGEKGGAYLASVHPGKGHCLFGSTPDMCANNLIADAAYKNNFQFMVNWLQGCKQPIMFDEKCHGYSAGKNAWYFVLRSPVGFVILQLILLTLVALFSLNQRFGQPVPVSNLRKISNLEFIDGLASTYERAHARNAVWAMLFVPLKTKLCKMLGIAPDSPLDDVAHAWAEYSGKNQNELQAFLSHAQDALEKQGLTDQELTSLVRTADGLIR